MKKNRFWIFDFVLNQHGILYMKSYANNQDRSKHSYIWTLYISERSRWDLYIREYIFCKVALFACIDALHASKKWKSRSEISFAFNHAQRNSKSPIFLDFIIRIYFSECKSNVCTTKVKMVFFSHQINLHASFILHLYFENEIFLYIFLKLHRINCYSYYYSNVWSLKQTKWNLKN